MAEPAVPFRPGQYYGPGVAALAAAVEGLHGDLLAVLELLGGVDPGLMSQLTAAPIGSWQAVVEAAQRQAARDVARQSLPRRPVERRVWTWAPSCQRPEEAFYVRDPHGACAALPALDTPGTGRRAEQVELWRLMLQKCGPLTEITQEEYELDANREVGDGRDDD